MALRACPLCKAVLDGIGQFANCPQCGHGLLPAGMPVLPPFPIFAMAPSRGSRDDDEDEGEEEDDEDDRPRRRSSSGSGAGTAAAGAAAGAAGMGLGMIVLIIGGALACCLCVVGAPIVFVIWGANAAVGKAKEIAERENALNNARMVAVGAHAYHDVHRNLPPPRMQKQLPGQPAPDLSWRVDILPHAGNQPLFNQFDKAQGFDQGKNKDLQTRMPSIYLLHGELGNKDTKFQYFTGPKTLFPDEKFKRTFMQIPDGTSNTILFAQSSTSVVWSKHADMTIQGGLSLPQGKFVAAICDGSARLIDRKNASDETIRLLIDPTDNQILPPGWDH